MKKSINFFLAFLTLGIFLGFSNSDNPNGLTKTNLTNKNKSAPIIINNNDNNPISTASHYSDDFTAPNDTAALKARGYLVYRNGTFDGSPPPNFWFTGRPSLPNSFPAFNGADSDYVASSFFSAVNFGDIDNWLILPSLNVLALDSICFRSRSPLNSIFPDSIRVMFNPLGGILPSSPGWIELGRFQAITDGTWELRSFVIPSSALGARLAIRYSVVDAGNGPNSLYIGIDALRVQGDHPLPVELASFVSVITNNNVTLKWTTATETNNSEFDIERSIVNGEWSRVGNVAGSGTTNSPTNYKITDRNLNSGNYNYRLKQIDLNGNFEYFNLSNEVVIGIPNGYELSQNYPNPFNPTTVINYQLPKDGNVKISVFDNSGKEIMNLVNGFKTAGYYTINFNASSLSSGIYYYKLSSDNFSSVKKMMLIK
ncbi:MAG: T9SS type A sorting domain-containing protein [Bacteroidota bacterium]|nr:T9SS type A sorting domain-containing protein [Bacteroidota bacterium]